MTFTLVSRLTEQLTSLILVRAENLRKEETERGRIALEVCTDRVHGVFRLIQVVVTRRKRPGHAERP